jgi:endonuclease I
LRTAPVILLASLLLLAFSAMPASSAIFLSELCDPANNYMTDRFIEIYNPGPDAVDLTGWSVVAIANNVDVTTWTLSGTIAAGQAKVCGNTTTVTGFTVDFQNAQWGASGYYNWNGKAGDGAKILAPGSTITDIVVATGTLFENSDMVRNSDITAPNTTYTPSEWTITAVTLATSASPGSHNGSTPLLGPVISGVATDPASPTEGVPVDVQATVVDTSRALWAVTLSWGTSSSSLTNVIGMTDVSGDLYRTSSQIPGMAGGATIYYRVSAQDSLVTAQSSIGSYTIPGGGGGVPPSVLSVGEMSDSTLLVIFSEPVAGASSQNPANYAVGAITAVGAVQDGSHADWVTITVRGLTAGTRTLTVNAVADSGGDVAYGATRSFNYVDVTIPSGYYDSAIGLRGTPLRIALHNIIKSHTVRSYDYAMTAFQTTDVKWNGKVWDMYSDIPGGTPPYEYTFGQTGQGATEGLGYNREHSFPQSWFNGTSPTYSDLHMLCPTDSKVNGYRSNYAFGVVGSATTTSLNGSKLGSSASAGFTGTVFEPIDAFKGDLARMAFYIHTRYLGEDSAWPGGPESDGADFYPWACNQYLAWSLTDAVSWKERMRNGAVYVLQNNRNPFIDHPEFVSLMIDSTNYAGVEPGAAPRGLVLYANSPNPFVARTAIGFDLPRSGHVALRLYDVSGRLVRTLADRAMEAGRQQVEWDGRDEGGTGVGAGLYFCRLESGGAVATRRIARVR